MRKTKAFKKRLAEIDAEFEQGVEELIAEVKELFEKEKCKSCGYCHPPPIDDKCICNYCLRQSIEFCFVCSTYVCAVHIKNHAGPYSRFVDKQKKGH